MSYRSYPDYYLRLHYIINLPKLLGSSWRVVSQTLGFLWSAVAGVLHRRNEVDWYAEPGFSTFRYKIDSLEKAFLT